MYISIQKIRAGFGAFGGFGGLTRDRLPGEGDALASETAPGGCPDGGLQKHFEHIRKRHGFRCRRSMSFVLRVSFRVSSRAEFAPGVCHLGCPRCAFSSGSGAPGRRIRSWGMSECGAPRAYSARGYDGNSRISSYGGYSRCGEYSK